MFFENKYLAVNVWRIMGNVKKVNQWPTSSARLFFLVFTLDWNIDSKNRNL